ncbi:hypothetical protein [Sulfurimonas sp.]
MVNNTEGAETKKSRMDLLYRATIFVASITVAYLAYGIWTSVPLFIAVLICSFAFLYYLYELITGKTLGTDVYGILAVVSFVVVVLSVLMIEKTSSIYKKRLDRFDFICNKESQEIIISKKEGWHVFNQYFQKGSIIIPISHCRPAGDKND